MRYLASCILLLLIPVFCLAQKFSASANAQVAIPQGEYQTVNGDAGFGLRLNFLYKPAPVIPLKFGLELGFLEKGRAVQYFSAYLYGYYDEFEVSATNNIFSLMFVTRLQPGNKRVRPFLDLTAGWNVFFSTVTTERLTYYSPYDESYSNSTKAHWAIAYGATAGIDIALNKRNDIGLELKVSYLAGEKTRYLTNPYINNNAEVSFDEKTSKTDMLIPQAGVRFTIQ